MESVSSARAPQPALVPLPGASEERPSDERLIGGIVSGDASIAAELYRHLAGVVDRTLYRVLGRREPDHDDLVQASFEQIVSTLAHHRFAGACSLRTWASTITTNVALKALRARRREREILDRSLALDDHPLAGSHDVEQEASVRADVQRLRTIVADMNPRRAEVVFLHEVLGHDLAEISVMLGTSVAAAQSLLVRGRRDLRAAMERSSAPGRARG